MTALLLALMAGLAGAAVGAASLSSRDWLIALVAGAAAFETAAMRPLLDSGEVSASVRSWRRLEVAGIVVGAKAVQVVTGRVGLIDTEFLVAVAVAMASWGLANATLTDIDAIERGIGMTDGATPLQRIRARFVAVGLLAVVCAGVGAVGVPGLVDLSRGAATSWSMAPLAYVLVGLLGVGAAARMAEERRWQRDAAVVSPSVSGRWSGAAVSTVAALGVMGVAVHIVSLGISAIPATGLAASGRFGEWISERAGALGAAVEAGQSERDPGADPPTAVAPEFDTVEPVAPWLGDVALWVLIAAVFAYAIVRGRNRRTVARPDTVRGPGIRAVLGSLWAVAVELVAAIWRLVRRLFWREASHGTLGGLNSEVRTDGASWWDPADPVRARIARAYRSAVSVVAASYGAGGRSETPREFARRVDDGRFSAVTTAFEEARYSDHHLTDEDASVAETAADLLDS